jgi:uncharacterized protein YqeY
VNLSSRLDDDLKQAMRAGDDSRRDALRLLKAALKNQQIQNRAPLDPQQELSIVQREAKLRKEAAEEYARLGRQDLETAELTALSVVQSYLPAQLSEEEVTRLVAEVIRESGASTPRDMGRVMSALMPRLQGRADGKLVSARVREALAAREARGS